MLFSARSTRGAAGLLLLLLALGFASASPPISASDQPAAEPPSAIVPPWVRHQRHRQAEREHGHGHGHGREAGPPNHHDGLDDGHEVRRSEGTGVGEPGGEGAKVGGREGHRSAPLLSSEENPSFESGGFAPGVADFRRPALPRFVPALSEPRQTFFLFFIITLKPRVE